jgi:hypothetical protein
LPVKIDEVVAVELNEVDWSALSTPVKNYLQRRRDLVLRKAPLAGYAGRAKGRFNVRVIADQMYSDWSEYLGTHGAQPTNHVLAQYIHDTYGDAALTELQAQFPTLA